MSMAYRERCTQSSASMKGKSTLPFNHQVLNGQIGPRRVLKLKNIFYHENIDLERKFFLNGSQCTIFIPPQIKETISLHGAHQLIVNGRQCSQNQKDGWCKCLPYKVSELSLLKGCVRRERRGVENRLNR